MIAPSLYSLGTPQRGIFIPSWVVFTQNWQSSQFKTRSERMRIFFVRGFEHLEFRKYSAACQFAREMQLPRAAVFSEWVPADDRELPLHARKMWA